MSPFLMLILVPVLIIAMFALVVCISIFIIKFTIEMPRLAIPTWITSYLLFWAYILFPKYGLIEFFSVIIITVVFLLVIINVPQVKEDNNENTIGIGFGSESDQ